MVVCDDAQIFILVLQLQRYTDVSGSIFGFSFTESFVETPHSAAEKGYMKLNPLTPGSGSLWLVLLCV